MQLVRPPPQALQPLARLFEAFGLVDQLAVQIQRLVGPDDQGAFGPHPHGLQLGQGVRDVAGTQAFADQGRLGGGFVHTRRPGREGHAGALQQGAPRGAGGGQDHLGHVMISATCPWRALIRLITAAAVSSTERRVTSMTGQ